LGCSQWWRRGEHEDLELDELEEEGVLDVQLESEEEECFFFVKSEQEESERGTQGPIGCLGGEQRVGECLRGE
jgi:hypothetical protein